MVLGGVVDEPLTLVNAIVLVHDDPLALALMDLAIDGCVEAGGQVNCIPVKIAGRRGTRLGTLDEKAIGELKTALLGASGLLIALSAAEPEYGDLVEEAIASLDDDWPLSRNIVGILGVSRKQSEDLSLIDHVWDCLVQAGALVIPGAVVVDAQAKSFDANGLPKVARHRASARDVGASVARLVKRMGL